MKKIIQTIKLKKFKSMIDTTDYNLFEGMYFILYRDNTYKFCWDKSELIQELEKDHIKPIHYIVEKKDMIRLEKDILIDMEEIN